VTDLPPGVFVQCYSLTNITIPNSVTNIGDYAFSQCMALPSVIIPNSVINIGNDAFNDCGNLTSVTIGNSVTSIGTNAFTFCVNLLSVTIPASVTNIEYNAFLADVNLVSVCFLGNAPSADSTVFSSAGFFSQTIVYYLPNTAGWYSPFGGVFRHFYGIPQFKLRTPPLASKAINSVSTSLEQPIWPSQSRVAQT